MRRRRRSSRVRRAVAAASLWSLAACAGSTRAPAGDLSPAPELATRPAAPEAGADRGSSAVLWPDEAFRATAPLAKAAPPLQFPRPHRFTTEEGIEVLLVHDDRLPIARLELVWPVGSVDDLVGREGAHAACFDLLDEGPRRLDRAAFEEAKDDVGVAIRAFAGSTESGISMSALAREFDAGVGMLGELLATPGLRPKDFERIIDDRVDGLAQTRATHTGVAARVLPRLVYGDAHPYGRQTSESSFRALRVYDCARIVRGLGLDGARAYASGAIDEARVRAALTAAFGRSRRVSPSARTIPAPAPNRGVYFVDVPDSVQSTVSVADLGPARDDPNYAAHQIMMRVLGGGFSSRINMNLREDKGYSYGARGSIQYARGASRLVTSARVRADATVDSVRQILAELERMRADPVGEAEFRRERDGTLAALPSGFATASAIARSYQALDRHGLPTDWYPRYEADLRRLSPSDVERVAREVVPPSPAVILVVGDGDVVRADLEALAAARGENLIELDRDGAER